jgi:hypothetical protein
MNAQKKPYRKILVSALMLVNRSEALIELCQPGDRARRLARRCQVWVILDRNGQGRRLYLSASPRKRPSADKPQSVVKGQKATLPHYQSGWPHVIALPLTVSCSFRLDEALPDHHLMQETAGCSAVSIEINS